jgi:hypothetical protein
MNTYTDEDLIKLAEIVDGYWPTSLVKRYPSQSRLGRDYTEYMKELLKTEPSHKDAVCTFLCANVGGGMPGEVIKAVFEDSKEDMPIYLASDLFNLKIVAEWRLALNR